MNHTPALLEYFAAHETLADLDHAESASPSLAICESLVGKRPDTGWKSVESWEWEAKWRAKLRFIRAKAMTEEAERIRSTEITRQSDGTQKKTGLSFSEALDAMKSGKSVRRNEWVPGSIAMVNGQFKDSADPIWGESIYSNDILANDWEIVE